MIGNDASETTSSAECTLTCVGSASFRATKSLYAYPARSDVWKKTRHVVQTAAAPPNQGRICFAMIG